MQERRYAAIDLKSFYASVECRERGLDPLDTNLVVADSSRTEKTICLAVTPSLKEYGIPGRARLFEALSGLREINKLRLYEYRKKTGDPNAAFKGSSYIASELKKDPSLEAGLIIAKPQMALYMKYSARIFGIYLKYFSDEDMTPYSVDEVFIDLTAYLNTYKKTPRELIMTVIKDVLETTGITATAGIGTNLYLCKAAMDIVAKHIPPDENGVRIAELDEMSYRRQLWAHRPITDFWRVGAGTARRLERHRIFTMGDIALISANETGTGYDEELFYRLFGKNAELLINHAWGYEPVTIPDIKAHRPRTNSLSSGQVLQKPYDFEKTGIIVREMADALSLELVRKGCAAKCIVITIGYDAVNLSDPEIKRNYKGGVKTDRYGRKIPVHSRGTANLGKYTSSSRLIVSAAAELFERIAVKELLVRRINVTAAGVIPESDIPEEDIPEQLDFFSDHEAARLKREQEIKREQLEKNMQKAILSLKSRYGKNAVLRGMNLQEGATARSRNEQIGGHKA